MNISLFRNQYTHESFFMMSQCSALFGEVVLEFEIPKSGKRARISYELVAPIRLTYEEQH